MIRVVQFLLVIFICLSVHSSVYLLCIIHYQLFCYVYSISFMWQKERFLFYVGKYSLGLSKTDAFDSQKDSISTHAEKHFWCSEIDSLRIQMLFGDFKLMKT